MRSAQSHTMIPGRPTDGQFHPLDFLLWSAVWIGCFGVLGAVAFAVGVLT